MDVSFKIYPHQCKDELLARLPSRLQGYSSWIPTSWRIIVIIDRDDEDCTELKNRLERIACDAGLRTRSTAGGGEFAVVNRLAIEELEAWFFGDWEAVVSAYPRVSATIPRQAKYRDPDNIAGGTWEAFERVLKKAGYFQTGLRKIEAARRVASQMNVDRNSSRSFQAMRKAFGEMN